MKIFSDIEENDVDRIFVEMDDGLRLIFENGKYVGFYIFDGEVEND